MSIESIFNCYVTHNTKQQILFVHSELEGFIKQAVVCCVNLVCLHVFLHIGLLGKGSATHNALKRLLSCVAEKGKQF